MIFYTATTHTFASRLIVTVAFVICGFLLYWAIKQLWHNSYAYRIRHCSQRYMDIAKLNDMEDYTFYITDPHPRHIEELDTKKAFDEFQFDDAMHRLITDETEMFDRMIFSVMRNKETLRKYHDALKLCSPYIDKENAENNGLDYYKARKAELQQIRRILPHPVTNINFQFTIRHYNESRKQELQASKIYTLEEVFQLRKQDPTCQGPVETFVEPRRRWGDEPQMAEVDFRYNAEDDFQEGWKSW